MIPKNLFITLGLTMSAVGAYASPIYINSDQGDFGMISTTGVYTHIGTTRYATGAPLILGDIGVAQNGDVYGTEFGGNFGLYKISTVDATATFIGNVGGLCDGGTIGPNGAYYADIGNGLYTINLTNGLLSPVGTMGSTTDGDFQFDSNGNMWMTGGGALWKVDPTTGASVEIGSGMGVVDGMFGLAWQGGVLYGFGSSQHVYTIDRNTGLATLTNAFSGDPFAGGTYGADTQAVPEPATMLMAGLLMAPLLKKRRQ